MYLEQSSSCGSQACKIVGPVYIDKQAKIAATAVIGPNVSIGPGCIVGEGVRIKEAILLRDVVVKDHVCILNAIIGWSSRIGEWSRVQGSSSNGGDEHVTIKGIKKPSVAILGTSNASSALLHLGGDITVSPEVIIRDCIVLPHKELATSYHNEIIM